MKRVDQALAAWPACSITTLYATYLSQLTDRTVQSEGTPSSLWEHHPPKQLAKHRGAWQHRQASKAVPAEWVSCAGWCYKGPKHNPILPGFEDCVRRGSIFHKAVSRSCKPAQWKQQPIPGTAKPHLALQVQ